MKSSHLRSPARLTAALLVASLPAMAASMDPVTKPNPFTPAKPIEALTVAGTLTEKDGKKWVKASKVDAPKK